MRLLALSVVALSASTATAAVIPLQTANQLTTREIHSEASSLVARQLWNPFSWSIPSLGGSARPEVTPQGEPGEDLLLPYSGNRGLTPPPGSPAEQWDRNRPGFDDRKPGDDDPNSPNLVPLRPEDRNHQNFPGTLPMPNNQ